MMEHSQITARPRNWVAAVRHFARTDPPERCELCNDSLPAEHSHLIEPPTRRLLCACIACALLFDNREDRRYRRVPRRARMLADFQMTDLQWDALLIPIGMAFFFYSSIDDRIVALYPGPAGAMESQLHLTAWADLIEANPVLREFEPDVEALLVNRIDGAREYYSVPIDRCYALVGLMRTHWRGLSGGAEAQAVIGEFFASLRETAITAGGAARA